MNKPYTDVRGEQYIYLLMAINAVKEKGNDLPNNFRVTVVGNIQDNMLHRQFMISKAENGNALLTEKRRNRHGGITARYFLIINHSSRYPKINTIKFGLPGGWIVDCSSFGYHDERIDDIKERVGL